ncbi:MAG: hypothetical protein JRN62_06005 [Nitrososphaerota archaeon]|nr:hypothetical protein [Nitrososphaerota archaeon]
MRQEIVSRLERLKDEKQAGKPRKIALGAFIEDLIWPVLEGDEVLRRYGPFLEEFGVEQDRIYIKDNRVGRIAELTLRDDVWSCNLDNTDNCVHIGFAWAIPKVYRVMMARGKRKPSVKEK